MVEVDKARWTARAAMCELLALSLRYPDEMLSDVISSGEWVSAARELASALDLALPGSFGESLLDADKVGEGGVGGVSCEAGWDNPASVLRKLRPEATRLFVGAPNPVCSPYEGVWRAEDDGVQPLMFVNPHSMDVERFCRACGLGRPEGTNEPLDHAATEFELTCLLASVVAGIAEPVVPEVDLPGGSARAACEEFFDEHQSAWMRGFSQRLESEARLPFYRSVAQLISAYLDLKGF